MEQIPPVNRNFNTISPSAKWILFMKGHTDIPFAKQAAELVEYPQTSGTNDANFWGRTLHFEGRYWSIDQLLSDLPITNILELSSGFSFRGLDFTKRNEVYYIDTDLPDIITHKKDLITALDTGTQAPKGRLELQPLNALDEKRFNEIVSRFPPGEIAIVNEGLLIYLDTTEKEKLCGIIHKILKDRGGYWITGDIYIKIATLNINLGFDEQTKKFFDDHNVEQNRFESFEIAEAFFKKTGFVVDKEADVDFTRLVSFPYVMNYATEESLQKFKEVGKIHATWRLRLADDSAETGQNAVFD